MASSRRNERGFESFLIRAFEKIALRKGRKAIALPTGGGDTELLADLIFSEGTRFGLIEMKDASALTVTEKKKVASNSLCVALKDDSENRFLHDETHYIAWGRENSKKIGIDVYRSIVCNRNLSDVITHDYFIDNFISSDSNIGLSREDFLVYIKWLLNVTNGSGCFSFILDNDLDDSCAYIEVLSIPELVHTLGTNNGSSFGLNII